MPSNTQKSYTHATVCAICKWTYGPLGDVIRPLVRWNRGWLQTNSAKSKSQVINETAGSINFSSRHQCKSSYWRATGVPGVLMADCTMLSQAAVQEGSTGVLRPLHPHCQGALQETHSTHHLSYDSCLCLVDGWRRRRRNTGSGSKPCYGWWG